MTECSIDGCGKHARTRGWCSMHYGRWLRHGDPLAGARVVPPVRVCDVDECGRLAHGRGMCEMHYQRWRKHGSPHMGARSSRPSQCSVDGCVRPHYAHGWCRLHYRRWMRQGDPTLSTRDVGRPMCVVDGCMAVNSAHGLCSLHLQRWQKHGSPALGVVRMCSVCDDLRVAGIDAALDVGVLVAHIAADLGLSATTVARHASHRADLRFHAERAVAAINELRAVTQYHGITAD